MHFDLPHSCTKMQNFMDLEEIQNKSLNMRKTESTKLSGHQLLYQSGIAAIWRPQIWIHKDILVGEVNDQGYS